MAILARKDKFRLALMTLMLRSIDAMSNAQYKDDASPGGGTLSVAVRAMDATIAIDIAATPTNSALFENTHLWRLDAVDAPKADGAWVAHGIQLLVENNGGVIEYEQNDPALGATHITRLRFPAAVL